MPADRESTSASPSDRAVADSNAPLCAMQAWFGESAACSVSAAERLRDFTREILGEEQEPERWDGLS